MIKFLTAGNVDDGKSSLIGRLLYDSDSLFEDQIEEVKNSTEDSFDGDLDFSLFLDGLVSERKQKITIDVAYRYFSYQGKKFIIADAPGHEEYTRNMAVAASNSDVIVILIDVTKGVRPQTLRHSYIASLFGIKKVIVAVNKMDLIDYDQSIFDEIRLDYLQKTKDLSFEKVDFVPVSAKNGENVVKKSDNIEWYSGKSIMEILNEADNIKDSSGELRMLVQNVIKHKNKRLYQGFVTSGELKLNQEILIYPSQKTAKITKIIRSEKLTKQAQKFESITFELDKDVDLERGSVLTSKNSDSLIFDDQLKANLIWFGPELTRPELESKELLVKINHNYLPGLIKIEDCNEVTSNQIIDVNLNLSKKIAFDRFINNKFTGAFLLIDSISNDTVACGIVN